MKHFKYFCMMMSMLLIIHTFPSGLRIEVWAICFLSTDRPQVRQCLIDRYSSLQFSPALLNKAGLYTLFHTAASASVQVTDVRGGEEFDENTRSSFFSSSKAAKWKSQILQKSPRTETASWRGEAEGCDREVVEGAWHIVEDVGRAARDTNLKFLLSSRIGLSCWRRVELSWWWIPPMTALSTSSPSSISYCHLTRSYPIYPSHPTYNHLISSMFKKEV